MASAKFAAVKSTPLPSSFVLNASMCAAQCAAVEAEMKVPVPAALVYTLLSDPAQHERIFTAIEGSHSRLVAVDGPRRRYELDLQARWRFWRVGGLCENRLWLDTDADQGTVSFRLREPGFLRTYEGTWQITPAESMKAIPRPLAPTPLAGVLASLTQPLVMPPAAPQSPPAAMPHAGIPTPECWVRVIGLRISPKIAPPAPLGGLLKKHAAGQVEEMMRGLLAVVTALHAEQQMSGLLASKPLWDGDDGSSVNSSRSSSASRRRSSSMEQ